jgi:hypothetical protein
MAEGREILVLRDEAGTPFLVPQAVVEQEELIAFRVGEDDYLVPRKTLLESVVPETQSTDDAEGLSIRGPDGTRVWLSTDTLELARVVSAKERAAAEQMLDVDVVAHSQLAFEITPLGRGEIGYAGRGMAGRAFVS